MEQNVLKIRREAEKLSRTGEQKSNAKASDQKRKTNIRNARSPESLSKEKEDNRIQRKKSRDSRTPERVKLDRETENAMALNGQLIIDSRESDQYNLQEAIDDHNVPGRQEPIEYELSNEDEKTKKL